MDFTLAAFDAFCQRITHMPVFTLDEYFSRTVPPPRPYVILRIDVDYRVQHAVYMARIAHHYHVAGSFYFRHPFDLNAMRAIADLGHETGYHYETLDTCRGDFAQAEKLFLTHLDYLRTAGLTIHTVAAHGSPPTAPTYRANADLFRRAPDLLQRAQLAGEATLNPDFSQVTYISDATWRWHRYVNYTPFSKGQPTSLRAVIAELPHPNAALYLTFHPQQWFAHPASAVYFRVRHLLGRWILRSRWARAAKAIRP